MAQVSEELRSTDQGYAHWCPACSEMHGLPHKWEFNGNLDSPSFRPSFRHAFMQRVIIDGKWTGEWVRDGNGEPIPACCHYILTDGMLHFCADCTHALAGRTVPLPPLPPFHRDDRQEEIS